MSKVKALTVNGDLSAVKVNCNQFESGNGVVTIDVEGNVSIDSCAGPNGCEGGDLHCEGIVSCADFKVYKTGETYTSSSSTDELIKENLSGVMLWISDDGTFYKDEGFEGAIVLDPKPGIYSDDPITVVDYASLYPNSIRSMFVCTYHTPLKLINKVRRTPKILDKVLV